MVNYKTNKEGMLGSENYGRNKVKNRLNLKNLTAYELEKIMMEEE